LKPDKLRIMFVCGRNQWRSPTAAHIYANDQRLEVRSAGVSAKSRHTLSDQDIKWADLIFVMEQKYQKRISETFRHYELPPIESLEIPDEYPYMDPELVILIEQGTEHFLQAFFRGA